MDPPPGVSEGSEGAVGAAAEAVEQIADVQTAPAATEVESEVDSGAAEPAMAPAAIE